MFYVSSCRFYCSEPWESYLTSEEGSDYIVSVFKRQHFLVFYLLVKELHDCKARGRHRIRAYCFDM